MSQVSSLTLRAQMRQCDQMPGLSILAHGQLVAWRYRGLLRHLRDSPDADLPGWRLPSWLLSHAQSLLALQAPYERAIRYQIYHDCGKPQSLVRDDAGRTHFPDHANVSADLFLATHPDLALEAALIREDMRLHTMPAAELEDFMQLRSQGHVLWPTLLLTALCELHANAAMFGGVGTTSFKAKFSQIDRRGKAMCKRAFN